ncbi:MAG: SIS domain-containing protein [Phenylobacterium sp.]|nr:SIS domain-containing protein [Phenylobacterium sp.]MBI1198592.1 SIS domain-containing protein [Phenylobacterium sp.]
MYVEAGEAADAVARALERNAPTLARIAGRLRSHSPLSVTTCARGSSDAAATYAKYLVETLIGAPTSSAAPSVASVYSAPVRPAHRLCLAISQSGRSPDLLRSVQAHKDAGGYVVALVNDTASPLADLADELLAMEAAPERSVAATKSFIASLALLAALLAAWSDRPDLQRGLQALPDALRQAFARDWPEVREMLRPAASAFVLGRGYGLAAAQEAALKLKEACGLHAEAFSSAEVRHGPMALVGPDFPVLAFASSDPAGDDVRAVADEFRGRGARVAVSDVGGLLPASPVRPMLEPIVQIQGFYRLVNALSIARGFDPDAPPHLRKVTTTT